MTRAQWRDLYNMRHGHNTHNHTLWKLFRGYLQGCDYNYPKFWTEQAPTIPNFLIKIDELNMNFTAAQVSAVAEAFFSKEPNSFAHCEPCEVKAWNPGDTIPCTSGLNWKNPIPAEQGNYPMNKLNTTTANITVMPAATAAISAKTDIQEQREYLSKQLNDRFSYWSDEMVKLRGKLREQFNMDGPTKPRSFQSLLDTIKAGEYEIDQKKVASAKESYDEYGYEDYDTFEEFMDRHYQMFHFVKFTKFPGADRAGFNAAEEALQKAIRDAADTIMIQDPKDGLAALKALENWTPPGKAS